jgi:hypothetical protein
MANYGYILVPKLLYNKKIAKGELVSPLENPSSALIASVKANEMTGFGFSTAVSKGLNKNQSLTTIIKNLHSKGAPFFTWVPTLNHRPVAKLGGLENFEANPNKCIVLLAGRPFLFDDMLYRLTGINIFPIWANKLATAMAKKYNVPRERVKIIDLNKNSLDDVRDSIDEAKKNLPSDGTFFIGYIGHNTGSFFREEGILNDLDKRTGTNNNVFYIDSCFSGKLLPQAK